METIKNLISLSKKKILITGATGGIGEAICFALAELGADLVLVDKPGSNFNKLVDFVMKNWNVSIDCIECDLESERRRCEMIDYVIKHHNSLDVLINNAAFVGESNLKGWVEPFEKQTLETWRRAIEVNLTAPFHLSQAFFPLLKKGNNSSIINISSIYGIRAPDYSLYTNTKMGNPSAYSSSKGGLIQLTRWLSTTVAPEVRVNAISPGGVWRNQPKEFTDRYISKTPLKRMATEDDLKGAIIFLASDLSAYMTGQNLVVDGGWSV